MHKIISTTLAILWGGVIIGFTLQEGSASGDLSGAITQTLFQFFERVPGFTTLFNLERFHTFIRALAHMFNYFVFGLLVTHAFAQYTPLVKTSIIKLVIFGFLYGFFDETIQRFVPGRAFTWVDIALDTTGFLIAVVLYYVTYQRLRVPKKTRV